MKLALLSESPADEAAVRILAEGLLGRKTESIRPPLRARGWPNVLQILPAVLRHLQFRTQADALIVVADADDTVIHHGDHSDPNAFHPLCRLCQMELAVRRTGKHWKLPEGRAPLKVGLGLAVPAVEGWYLFGKDPDVGEQRWEACRQSGVVPYTRKELKLRVYGTSRPSLHFETQRAREEARRLVADLPALENAFPVGFGDLARKIRGWK